MGTRCVSLWAHLLCSIKHSLSLYLKMVFPYSAKRVCRWVTKWQKGTVHPKCCLEGLFWSSPIAHMQHVRKWALKLVDRYVLGLTHCCIIPVLYWCITMGVTSELFISVSHQGIYQTSSLLINWVPLVLCIKLETLARTVQNRIIQSLVKYRKSSNICRLVICPSTKHAEVIGDLLQTERSPSIMIILFLQFTFCHHQAAHFGVAFISPADIACFKEGNNSGLILCSVRSWTSDWYLNSPFHVDYVTCLCCDPFLFSIWYSWCRVFNHINAITWKNQR